MLKPAVTALILTLVALPGAASAQSMGADLDAPVLPPLGTSAAASRATPEPQVEAAAEPSAAEIPEPPSALSRPYPRRVGVDPEIQALRATPPAHVDARRAARLERRQLQLETLEANPSALSFGSSFGVAWGGVGIGVAGGALIGSLAGAGVCEAENRFNCTGIIAIGAALGAGSAAPLGAAVAVWLHGDSRGAGGNFFAALGGSYLGAGVGAAIMAGMLSSNDLGLIFASPIGAAVGLVLSTLGATAGYHLSADGSDEEAPTAQAQTTIVPTFSTTQDGLGATVGAAGTF